MEPTASVCQCVFLCARMKEQQGRANESGGGQRRRCIASGVCIDADVCLVLHQMLLLLLPLDVCLVLHQMLLIFVHAHECTIPTSPPAPPPPPTPPPPPPPPPPIRRNSASTGARAECCACEQRLRTNRHAQVFPSWLPHADCEWLLMVLHHDGTFSV